jgi:hypothetical protein
MIGMAMMHPAHCADDGREFAKTRRPQNGTLSLRPKLLTISAIALAMGLAGCAREPAHRELSVVQREVKASHVRSPLHARINAKTQQQTELHVRRPDPALLAPQPAPNCEFKRADVKAVDPDQWARLKAEYERQCYQDAEKAARDRLGQLQATSLCEVERVPQQRPRDKAHRAAIGVLKN